MIINWPLVVVLFCLSLPGVCIAIPRLIYFLLPNSTPELKRRFSRFAVAQTLFMILVMSFVGTALSSRTGLHAPLLEALLQGKAWFNSFQITMVPTVLYSLLALIVFCGLYYRLVETILDEQSLQAMAKLRSALGWDGCILYGGVVEEILVRWGLMNLVMFFALLFFRQNSNLVVWSSIIFSGVMFGIGQIPAYIAAGCVSSRRFIYSILLLSLWQSLVFGFLFWQYGLISSMLAHMLFHLGWACYDSYFNAN